MGGAISSLLDISRRSLQNTSQAIRVVGNNVANVNTDGYTRREIDFVDKVGNDARESSFGLGADIGAVTRRVDDFLNKQVDESVQDRAQFEARDSVLAQTQSPFSVDKTTRHIGFTLSEFMSSLNDLQANPGDTALRSQLIQSGQELTQSIRDTYTVLSGAQRDADNQMRSAVTDVNNITSKIAVLNQQISVSKAGNQDNLGLQDTRDSLLKDLSEKISFNTVQDSNGQVSVYLANGFGLVSGSKSNTLTVSNNSSAGPFPAGLDGQALGAIVWDSSPANAGMSDVDLTKMIAAGSGQIAGLLNVRGVPAKTDINAFQAVGDLPDLASRVEAVAQDLLLRFNNIYRPYDGAAQASADLAGNPPQKFGLFNINNGVLPAAGGPEIVTDLNSSGQPNFASRISFLPTDPATLALSKDENPTPGVVTFSAGNGQIATDLLNAANDPLHVFTVGNFTFKGSIEDLYQTTVTKVGAAKDQSANDLKVAQDRETQTTGLQSSLSGVSIDEELTKLISFQRSFQASSRLIKVSDELLGQILQAVGA